jgi:hypothetical protein
MTKHSPMRAAALAAALLAFALAGCGDDDPAGTTAAPTTTANPAAEQARVAADAQTRCANGAPPRRASTKDATAYGQEGLARLQAITAALRSVDAPGKLGQPIEQLLNAYGPLRPQYEGLLAGSLSSSQRRRLVRSVRAQERTVQQQAETTGLSACGPLAKL